MDDRNQNQTTSQTLQIGGESVPAWAAAMLVLVAAWAMPLLLGLLLHGQIADLQRAVEAERTSERAQEERVRAFYAEERPRVTSAMERLTSLERRVERLESRHDRAEVPRE